jgi:hypothetical protein
VDQPGVDEEDLKRKPPQSEADFLLGRLCQRRGRRQMGRFSINWWLWVSSLLGHLNTAMKAVFY